jgi:DNA-binding PadR family transcriptional regulator
MTDQMKRTLTLASGTLGVAGSGLTFEAQKKGWVVFFKRPQNSTTDRYIITEAGRTALARAAWHEADNAWHATLVERYGKDAGSMRYLVQGKGMDCEKVRAAYEARHVAMRAYMAMQQD